MDKPIEKHNFKKSQDSTDCRLCGASTSLQFDGRVMGLYEVAYFRCCSCASLQVQRPFWLREAYEVNLSCLDTGAVQRTLRNFATCFALARIFSLKNIVDMGGGDGLFCRLLRDFGFNCYVNDKFALPTYAQGYSVPEFEIPDLVTAFEVVEHFAVPSSEIEQIFSKTPRIVILSTELYKDQDKNWWYLAPESGQHVFFYSIQSMQWIAKNYGYKLVMSGGYSIFIRQDFYSFFRAQLIKFFAKYKTSRVLLSLVFWLPTRGVNSDYSHQLEILQRRQNPPRV